MARILRQGPEGAFAAQVKTSDAEEASIKGFPHDQTTHHFRLLPDGGAIEVTVNDAKTLRI